MTTPPHDAGRAAHRIALLLSRHGEELARHIRRLVRDDEAAQDLLQETMIRAHGALGGLRTGSNTRAWLYRIATNAALNHLRSRSRERVALRRHAAERETAVSPHVDGPGADDAERREALWARVSRLPPRQRLALTLRLVDELDYEEIARRVGGTAATARANVYQATRTLRREVKLR
jgi:RNA polymerase sigma-70 factor (ECF subfamily)